MKNSSLIFVSSLIIFIITPFIGETHAGEPVMLVIGFIMLAAACICRSIENAVKEISDNSKEPKS